MELTAEQRQIRDLVREFVAAEVTARAAEAERNETFPEDVWDDLAELGLAGLTVPEEYGGFDADGLTYSLVNEELAAGHLAVATALSVHCLVTSCIRTFGSDQHRERWLPEMVTGRPVGAFALSEPHAGSNPAAMTAEARLEEGAGPGGEDQYVLNGEKQWITNGRRSDVLIVFAKTDRTDEETITQFLVPKDLEGLAVGPEEDKLGLRAIDTTSLQFEDVRIPAENRLTPVGEGLKAAFEILTDGRIAIASQAVGVARAALEDAITYATEREQFGEPIAEIQSIGHKLAEMRTNVQAARLLARDAARKNDEGVDPMAASMAKYFASETAVEVAGEAIQIHGGYGYTTEFDVERYYRDAKVTTIYEGTTEIQKEVIARELRE